ncbi:MAG TPA: bifunctional DNA-formamidopyrimidine glycosylase/DNA-(apurinic or apyrimidinic site) lyase [bacterium]|nr:bifunctional DNA-formamidopyrimidine glycosylase/DNA-(apurinic or apyrimidinic site) lyase [bacterium]
MPELPEVETVRAGLAQSIIGKYLYRIESKRSGTVSNYTDKPLASAKYGRITAVNRRGKYLLLQTDADLNICIHLRMTGKLILLKNSKPLPPHTRAVFYFSDQIRLAFDDLRTFGRIDIYRLTDSIPSLTKLGPEPLSASFSASYLCKAATNRKKPIKNLLLDQQVIAGIGNIYAIEALHRTKLDPRLPAGRLTGHQASQLVKEIKAVLREAIRNNGTSISDFRRIDDQTGEFQAFLRVYQQEVCKMCGARIQRIKQAGRSTYYCPRCQR